MESRYIDFDAARAERKKEPLLLHAYGQDFELPASMPASLFLDVVRMEQERSRESEVTQSDAADLLRRVLPEDVLDNLLARDDFALEDLVELAGMVIRAYSSGPGESGEAPAPNRATRRATAK